GRVGVAGVGDEGPRIDGTVRAVGRTGVVVLEDAHDEAARGLGNRKVVARPGPHLVAHVGVEVALRVVPAPVEVLRVAQDGLPDRPAAAVLAFDVALQLTQRVVASEVEAVGGPEADLDVQAPVAALELVRVLDEAQVEAPSELVLDLARARVDAGDVEVTELAVDAVHAHRAPVAESPAQA